MKVSNKTRLFRSHKQLIYPAKKLSSLSLADAVDGNDFGGTSHLSRMDRKTFAVHRESAQFVTRQRFSLLIRPRVADALVILLCIFLYVHIATVVCASEIPVLLITDNLEFC